MDALFELRSETFCDVYCMFLSFKTTFLWLKNLSQFKKGIHAIHFTSTLDSPRFKSSEHTRWLVAAKENTSQRQIASRVVENSCENLCGSATEFVAATSLLNSVWCSFLRLGVATKFCLEDKDFLKNSSCQLRVHWNQFVVVIDVSPRLVAANCLLVCLD